MKLSATTQSISSLIGLKRGSASCSHLLITISIVILFSLCTLTKLVSSTVYFKETFPSEEEFEKNWVYSKHTGKEYGKLVLSAGKYYDDPVRDLGIKTSEDARFYAISSKFEDSKFDNLDKDLIFQFSVKHEQLIDCGGGYLKLFNCKLDQEQMHGDTEYSIMFGPDICGPVTKKVHVIFNYKGKNLLINKDIRCKDDEFTHLYRLHVKPDNTYKVLIDGETVEKGELETDWDFLQPKKIKDPNAKKPSDWEDNEKIDDPDDKKPDDWDVPEYIPDPEAKRPDDWDEEMDGEWQPGKIPNPAFKGEWKPRQIDNPNYKGPWVHPEIDNPEYVPDDKLYHRPEICAVGLDVWQVKSGSIFDNILLTDDEKEADAEAEIVLKKTIEGEKKMKKEKEAEEAEKEKAKKDSDEDKDLDDDSKADDSASKDEEEDKPSIKDEL